MTDAEIIPITSVAQRASLQNELMNLEDETKEKLERIAELRKILGVIAVVGVRE